MKSKQFSFTEYFETKVLLKRPYIQKDWCIRIVENPLKKEIQEDGARVRFWGKVDEFENKVFRIVTLSDELTIHNAFPDRRFKE